jgi:hypothetical protein
MDLYHKSIGGHKCSVKILSGNSLRSRRSSGLPERFFDPALRLAFRRAGFMINTF